MAVQHPVLGAMDRQCRGVRSCKESREWGIIDRKGQSYQCDYIFCEIQKDLLPCPLH